MGLIHHPSELNRLTNGRHSQSKKREEASIVASFRFWSWRVRDSLDAGKLHCKHRMQISWSAAVTVGMSQQWWRQIFPVRFEDTVKRNKMEWMKLAKKLLLLCNYRKGEKEDGLIRTSSKLLHYWCQFELNIPLQYMITNMCTRTINQKQSTQTSSSNTVAFSCPPLVAHPGHSSP